MNFEIKDLDNLMKDYPEDIELWGKEFSIDPKDQKKAEDKIGLPFTSSYKWFLSNLGGGELFGDEIYSIYNTGSDREICTGDIVYNHVCNIDNGLYVKDRLYFFTTSLGESFYFNYKHFQNGECPIFIGSHTEEGALYAANFYGFLVKFITTGLQ